MNNPMTWVYTDYSAGPLTTTIDEQLWLIKGAFSGDGENCSLKRIHTGKIIIKEKGKIELPWIFSFSKWNPAKASDTP